MSRLLMPGGLAQTFGVLRPDQIITDARDYMWWDPSDLSTLAQNADGTGAVTVGDPVGYMADKSGNAHIATALRTSERPYLQQTAGGLYYLDFDGIDDTLIANDIPWVGDFLVVAGFRIDVLSAGANFISADQVNVGAGLRRKGQFLREFASSLGTLAFDASGGFTQDDSGAFDLPTGDPMVLSAYHNPDALETWINSDSDGSTAFGGTPATMTTDCAVGSRADGRGNMPGRFFGGVVVNGSSTSGERLDLEAYIAEKSGVTL